MLARREAAQAGLIRADDPQSASRWQSGPTMIPQPSPSFPLSPRVPPETYILGAQALPQQPLQVVDFAGLVEIGGQDPLRPGRKGEEV